MTLLVFCRLEVHATRYFQQTSYLMELMCTNTCLHWVMACHVAGIQQECTPQQMQTVMQNTLCNTLCCEDITLSAADVGSAAEVPTPPMLPLQQAARVC